MTGEIPLTSQVPPDDQSGQILAQVLGNGWDSLAGADLVGSASTMAHEILASFNWVALTAVSLLFVLVVIQGVAGSAHEGVPLGRRYSCLWMPLRFAGAVTFLAPVFKGLSLFQVLILMSVGYSVNLANYVWGRGLDFFVESGGRLNLIAPAAETGDAQELAGGILKALVVQEYFALKMDRPVTGVLAGEMFFPPIGDGPGRLVLTMAPPLDSGLVRGDLGRIQIPCQSQEDICLARLSAVRGLMAELGPLAEALVEGEAVDGGLLARATEHYRLAIEPYLEMTQNEEAQKLREELGELVGSARTSGWITAGSYYWTIARINQRAARILYDQVSFSGGQDPASLDGKVLSDFEAVWGRLMRYQRGAFEPERAAGGSLASEFPSWEWFREKLSGAMGRYSLSLVITQLENDDPVAVLAGLGNFMVSLSEVVIGTRVVSMGLVYGTGQSAESLLGQVVSVFSGSVSSFLAGLAKGTVLALGPYILMLSLVFIGYGFFLAYFLPALPFVLWLSAVFGWLILVFESLVAAPLWAAAHALPEGEGLTGQARQGYYLFLGVLLRPPLMVFGFVLGLALVNVSGRIIGHIFSNFGFAYLSDSLLGVSGFLAFTGILGIAMVTATYRFFGLIVHLPDRVVNWIGQQIHGLGESQDVHESQGRYRTLESAGTRVLEPVARPLAVPVGAEKDRKGE